MKCKRLQLARIAALTVGLLFTGAARAEDLNFDPGSLVIPMQSNFQSACGTVSAYGLIWRILQSNQAGHYNASHPVTVYWTIADKQSINRCVPTNLHDLSSPLLLPNRNGTNWNDGCDVIIPDKATATGPLSSQPVTMAPLNAALPATGFYAKSAVFNVSTVGKTITVSSVVYPYSLPAYGTQTLTEAGLFNRIRYLGGPLVIAAADVQNVIDFLQKGDSFVTVAELKKFITPSTTCDALTGPVTSNHYVRVHQALVPFTATVSRKLNSVPPRIALVNLGTGVSTGILDKYLKNAGLDELTGCDTTHTCYGGCAAGSTSACVANGSVTGTGAKYPGLIYDNLDGNLDLHSTAANTYGILNQRDAKNRLIYKVLWAPHWQISAVAGSGTSLFKLPSDDPAGTTEDQNVRNNIGRFTDNAQTGLMSECASIGAFEGGSNTTPTNPGTSAAKFLSTNGWTINALSASLWSGRNCTDPDFNTGACMIYPAPSDVFSQIGDFTYFMVAGVVQDFVPQTGSSYVTGEQRLAVSYPNYLPLTDGSPTVAVAKAAAGNDSRTAFSWGQKGNSAKKATVLYLGGHDYSTVSVPGNRVVLNTLLNLGFDPISAEKSFTQPVGYVDPNGNDGDGSRLTVLGSTFDAVTGYPSATGVRNFTRGQQSQWVFPYYPGHIRDHSLLGGTVLASGENALNSGTLWDGNSALPLPGKRNLFTYLAGDIAKANKLTSYDNVGGTATGGPTTNGYTQTGWLPLSVNGSSLDVPGGSCVDKMKYSTTGGVLSFVSGNDGICDLQQALQFTLPTMTGSGASLAVDSTATKAAMKADLVVTQQMIQKIRGYCVASTTKLDGDPAILSPSDTQCNVETEDNRAQLGGFITSTPAIVPASAFLSNDARPTVAYAGGWDGQLHAFYVSGGEKYTGPPQSLHYPQQSASSTFVTPYAPPITPGQELWSFLPASQLPKLASNNARVDSSPVFGEFKVDLVGSGNPEWHTLLAASIGADSGREIFAFDVTNPTRPVLLWDLAGSLVQSGNYPLFSPLALAASTTSGVDDQSWLWRENSARFYNPMTYTDPGLFKSGIYDYGDLGGSVGMSVGQVNGGATELIVTSNSYGTDPYGNGVSGVEVFAVDFTTGQKLWQWQQAYSKSPEFPYNNPPPTATVTGANNYIDTVWVADLEGRLWELDARTGRNKNSLLVGFCTAASPCPIPAFQLNTTLDHPQPISSNLAVGLVPPEATGALKEVAGKQFIMFGTGGYDWVPSDEPGNVHMLIIDPTMRAATGNPKIGGGTWTASAASVYNVSSGVLVEANPFPLKLAAGEHVYGSVTLAGSDAFFASSNGPIGNDVMAVSATIKGSSYVFHLANLSSGAPATKLASTLANFGGVTVVHNDLGKSSVDYIVGQEVSKLSNSVVVNSAGVGTASPRSDLNPNGGKAQGGGVGTVFNWIRRLWSAPK